MFLSFDDLGKKYRVSISEIRRWRSKRCARTAAGGASAEQKKREQTKCETAGLHAFFRRPIYRLSCRYAVSSESYARILTQKIGEPIKISTFVTEIT